MERDVMLSGRSAFIHESRNLATQKIKNDQSDGTIRGEGEFDYRRWIERVGVVRIHS